MSGSRLVHRGTFVGTGAQLDITKVGFRPKKVVLKNQTGLCTLEWFESMAEAAGYKTVTDGTESFITANGITPLANGFRLGADADLNVLNEVVHYEAEE